MLKVRRTSLPDESPPTPEGGVKFTQVRGFEGRFPDEVTGLVQIDPTPSVNDFLSAFEEIGVGESGMEEFSEMVSKLMDNAPPIIYW